MRAKSNGANIKHPNCILLHAEILKDKTAFKEVSKRCNVDQNISH